MKEKQSNTDFNHQVLLQLLKASNLITNLADSFFPGYGTSTAEFNILMTLNRFLPAGLSQKDLSEELVIKKSNLVGIIDKLEEKNFVERSKSPGGDRRLNKIMLTDKGKKFIGQIQEDYFLEINQLINSLNSNEKASLTQGIEKLTDYLKTRLEGKKLTIAKA
jgi:DNA-binding MarR family transcriptional regulator